MRRKILLAMLAVVVITVAISALLTRRVTHQEIRKIKIAGPGGFENRVIHQREIPPEFKALDLRLLYTFAGATLVAILLTIVVSRRITRPIEKLNAAVNDMKPADIDGNDEIAQLGRSFNTMLTRIATQQDLRRRMVGDVAHELRTPLTNLRCELEAAQDGLKSADTTSLLEEVVHLSRLVDDLQMLAVAEAGALSLNVERIALHDVVAHIVDRVPNVTFEGEEVFVLSDPVRVGQIVRNLLSNALRHAASRVNVAVSRDGVVSVTDDGPGIPPADLPLVFERFYRVDDARSRATGGVGLGLAIVKQLVELQGGRVWGENVLPNGARFSFSLPMPPTAHTNDRPPRAPH